MLEDMARFTQSELKTFVFVSLRFPGANTIFKKEFRRKIFFLVKIPADHVG